MRLRRSLTDSDSGVAGVIGVILILAVVVTAYANAIRVDIPDFGAQAERDWNRIIGDQLGQFTRSLGEGLTAGAPMATMLDGPPTPQALNVPLIGHTEPFRPTGTLAFVPECATFAGEHMLANALSIEDLRASSAGCVNFRAEPTYSAPFAYRVELGGLLRVQGDRAVVLAGPTLDLDASTSQVYRVTIGVPGLRGHAATASVGTTPARIDLVPGPFSVEAERAPNAASATWELRTAYPTAWKAWYATQFEQAGFLATRASPPAGASSADFLVACAPVSCSLDGDGLGTVVINIEGPRVDAEDLRLSFNYGIFDVNIR